MTPDNEAAADAHPSDNVPVETVSATPLVVAKEPAADPGKATPAAAEPAKGTEAAEGTDATGKPPKLPEWAQKIVNDGAAKTRIAEKEARRLADELAALKAPKPDPAPASNAGDAAAANAAAPEGGYRTKADFDKAVAEEATKRANDARAQAARQTFDTNSNKAAEAGMAAFGKENFNAALANLNQVGILPYTDEQGRIYNSEILEMVLGTEDPAKVLYELGSDPDKAASLAGMTPAARAIEIAKMSIATPKKAADPLSKAPRPIPAVDGSARVTATPSDNDDDETFFAKREAELKAAGKW